MKICVIGGGSSYTPELLDGLIDRADKIGLDKVALHDIDSSRLEIVGGFIERMARKKGARLHIKKTTDLSLAVKGSRFVIAQVRVGQSKARKKDEELGARHGLIGQETTGVGGFSKALRTVPVMINAAKEMEKHSPEAILINFTNPSGLITEAILNNTDVNTIGLCNIPVTFHIEAAKAIGCDVEDIELDYIGLNHLSWIRGIKVKGEDVTERLLSQAVTGALPANFDELDYPPDFLKALKMVPMHYLRYFYMTNEMLAEQNKKEITRAEEVMEIEAELMEIYADPKNNIKPESLSKRGGAHYSLAALKLIEAVLFNKGDVQILNVKNYGAISSLPDNSVIETPCRVDKNGASPIPAKNPGPEVIGLIRQIKSYEELTIKAATKKDYQAALMALMTHPLGPDADNVKTVLDDIIKTHDIDL
jgi:6-phospho-beta-glucosidase